jgi:hypothetical protein
MNLSLYSIRAFIVLDTEGNRVLAKYYRPKGHPQGESKELLSLKEQKAFEKGLWQKTKKAGGEYLFLLLVCFCPPSDCFPQINAGDIILYDSHLVVYKHSLDLILYFVAGSTENEVMVHAALTSLSDALTMLLRNSLEKRGVLENLDLVLLCLDETIDDGFVIIVFCMTSLLLICICRIIVDTDAAAIASRVSRPRPDTTEIVINEQTIMSAYQTVKEKMQQRIGQLS